MSENDLWEGGKDTTLACGCCILQVIGHDSPTHTAFGRVLAKQQTQHDLSVQDLLTLMIDSIQKQRDETLLPATKLLQLGSVWKLWKPGLNDTTKGKQTEKLKRTRLFVGDANESWEGDSLRVHFRPSRFPAAYSVEWKLPAPDNPLPKPSSILHYNEEFGFLVVNKPSGLPSQATVDNGVENVLHQLRLAGFASCSLPQRLDIETEGLLLVAIKPEFSSFMGRLLQHKTEVAVGSEDATLHAIQKQYKCLVHVSSEVERQELLRQASTNDGVIEHYMDPNSVAPRPFETNAKGGWLKCLLRILDIGPLMELPTRNSSYDESDHLLQFVQVMQIHVELLTGRTHQIRGQLAALEFPLVGDPLYRGGSREPLEWDEARQRGVGMNTTKATTPMRLGLQCCSLRFPQPKWTTSKKKRPSLSHDNTSDHCCFQVQKAWWSDHVQTARVKQVTGVSFQD